ncbi:hypothetical protein Hypma_008501 [Hypsizygus marmoreus]|uniref:Uncharacterized protein n=1 Tax=Hypsizygus marmoreus TaxID=39966 RepID=A0A369JXL2_HYPMA|nr:hypothetical protein Hypma_008501 [Hypsizygus marmoreus]
MRWCTPHATIFHKLSLLSIFPDQLFHPVIRNIQLILSQCDPAAPEFKLQKIRVGNSCVLATHFLCDVFELRPSSYFKDNIEYVVTEAAYHLSAKYDKIGFVSSTVVIAALAVIHARVVEYDKAHNLHPTLTIRGEDDANMVFFAVFKVALQVLIPGNGFNDREWKDICPLDGHNVDPRTEIIVNSWRRAITPTEVDHIFGKLMKLPVTLRPARGYALFV